MKLGLVYFYKIRIGVFVLETSKWRTYELMDGKAWEKNLCKLRENVNSYWHITNISDEL